MVGGFLWYLMMPRPLAKVYQKLKGQYGADMVREREPLRWGQML